MKLVLLTHLYICGIMAIRVVIVVRHYFISSSKSSQSS
ncbi:hypothetical protein PRUB_a0990 [Pseudoalteromonas rubra]|uniref:Uncharacterized protein n=1 Tax=Pseudoalteromonas rubra TaxID=43658 RepID=A0A8T0C737_9GAMM|nr:hypothetical protein PRUB_a0990 [Pseudoalteromonas rubra]